MIDAKIILLLLKVLPVLNYFQNTVGIFAVSEQILKKRGVVAFECHMGESHLKWRALEMVK